MAAVNFGELSEVLNDKADTDLDNLNNSGKNVISTTATAAVEDIVAAAVESAVSSALSGKANISLDNLDNSGTAVISSIAASAASSAIASANFMKHFNTKAGVYFTSTGGTGAGKYYTCPSNGWVVFYGTSNGSSYYIGSGLSTGNSVQIAGGSIASFPVTSGTVIWAASGTSSFSLTFFPEV